jgi:surfactin synthase thioesterase subunit
MTARAKKYPSWIDQLHKQFSLAPVNPPGRKPKSVSARYLSQKSGAAKPSRWIDGLEGF